MRTLCLALLTAIGLFSAFPSQAQLQITSQTNAQALAQRLVGDGIQISNVQLTGSNMATGYFRNVGGTQIGLDSGIVLSTGRVATSGTNWGFNGSATNLASTTLSTPGDPQLQALVNNQNTFDGTVLEFDFVPLGDTVKFRYVFSSEEYPTFTCSNYNDVFAFFLSGPGITGSKNIALVPGTNIPVAINSINSGTPGGGNPISTCNAMGAGSPFPQYFVNNTGNTNFTHNGHTVVLTALHAVTPCQTYHLKIAIADVFDQIYDSGVFIEAKSLVSTPLQIINANPTGTNGAPYMVEGCTAGGIKISRTRRMNFPQPVNLFFAGTAQNGVDVMTIPATVTIPANDSIVDLPITPIADNILEGSEQLKIYITYGGCATGSFYADSITINLRDQVSAVPTIVGSDCVNPTGTITLNVPAGSGNAPYTYSLNGGTYQAGNSFTGLGGGNYIVSIKDSTGCSASYPLTVGLQNNVSVNILTADTSICQGATFTPRVASNGLSYSWTPTSAVGTPLQMQPVLSPSGNTIYILTAVRGQCFRTDTLRVSVFQTPSVNAGPDLTIINGDQVQLQATGTPGSTWTWTPPTGLSSTTVLQPLASPTVTTQYTVRQVSPQGCLTQDSTLVTVLNCVDPMTAFTPNGDGVNDRWLVTNGQCLKTARVEVYNRYGAQVYRNDTYSNNWDGTYQGKPLPDGTYYFVVRYTLINGKPREMKGNVTILR